MCGIFGYFDRRRQELPADQVAAMGRVLTHRGPDDDGVFYGVGVAIGNRRLSIIDIAGGHQPFLSDDGKIAVVQNGEIFNYIELAKELASEGFPCRTDSDTEVLLRLYERDGIDFVSQLNGMFSIAIYDGREDALYLMRDRIGVKPLYIWDGGDRLLFASEIKALLAADVPRELDPVALNQFLSFNYVPPPLTLFKGIMHLVPGHMLRVDRQGVTTRRWWDLADRQIQVRSEEAWIDDFLELLDDAVRLRLRADVPFGAFLSGGVDSSTVVGLMSRHTPQPVRTFCIGFNEPQFDESRYAEKAASRFGTIHTTERVDAALYEIWPLATYFCDQPHGDMSFLPTYEVARLAAQHMKVVLTGDGGDELFAGYDKYRDFFTEAADMDDVSFQRRYLDSISLFTPEILRQIYMPEFLKSVGNHNGLEVVKPLFERCKHFDRLNQALYLDMVLLLPGNNLVKPDRMGMAVSLEARTPFLDYRMMEFAFTMPGDLKLRNGETKYLYKKAVIGLIGEELAHRKKQMFTVPVGEWFRGELAAFAREMLSSERFIGRGIFDPRAVDGLIRRHQSGEANYTREIRALIALELWARIFLDHHWQRPPALWELCADLPSINRVEYERIC